MKRRVPILIVFAPIVVVFAMVLVACGGSGNDAGSVSGAGSDRPTGGAAEVAPDFSLKLDDGSTFVLSEATKPTYLVFWAEW